MEPLPSIFDTDLHVYRPVCDGDIARLAQCLAEVIAAHSDDFNMASAITRAVNELIWNYVQTTMSLDANRFAN